MSTPMIPRERMLRALDFQPVDVVPLQIHPSPAGLFEHGQKLLDLMQACGHDFSDLGDLRLPSIPATDFDSEGRYHVIRTDEWGTTWEHRIFGVWGYRTGYPLADISHLAEYKMPAVERLSGVRLAAQSAAQPAAKAQQSAAQQVAAQQSAEGEALHRHYFHLGGGASLFETMQSLRPFEDVLIDIAGDTPEINLLADRLVEYNLRLVENALVTGVDAIAVGDDFGTQQGSMFSPQTWRRFFLPRYQALTAPVKKAGKRIFFHSCGQIGPILEDLRQAGADVIWPQLPLFDLPRLAQRCRELGLAVQLHPDRGELMQHATPAQVRAYILELVETFEVLGGGSFLYLEVDPGFPWENVQAMFTTAMELRGQAAPA